MGALAVLGLHSDTETLYRALLRGQSAPGRPVLPPGWSVDRAEATMDELRTVGLVEDEGGSARVVDPAVAVRRLLAREEREIERRRRRLAEAHEAIEQMESDYQRARVEVLGNPQIDAVDAALAPAALVALIRAGHGPVSTLHQGASERSPADRALFEALAEAASSGRVLRGIYPRALLDDQLWEAWARRRAALGERQRLSNRPVPAVVIIGGEAVAIGGGADRPASVVLMSRAPQLVQAFTDTFEAWWQNCSPLPGGQDQGEGADEQQRLLSLLAAGCKDETVARLLGLSVRTVRRRVAELMDSSGASTRMQLGVQLARRGLV